MKPDGIFQADLTGLAGLAGRKAERSVVIVSAPKGCIFGCLAQRSANLVNFQENKYEEPNRDL